VARVCAGRTGAARMMLLLDLYRGAASNSIQLNREVTTADDIFEPESSSSFFCIGK